MLSVVNLSYERLGFACLLVEVSSEEVSWDFMKELKLKMRASRYCEHFSNSQIF